MPTCVRRPAGCRFPERRVSEPDVPIRGSGQTSSFLQHAGSAGVPTPGRAVASACSRASLPPFTDLAAILSRDTPGVLPIYCLHTRCLGVFGGFPFRFYMLKGSIRIRAFEIWIGFDQGFRAIAVVVRTGAGAPVQPADTFLPACSRWAVDIAIDYS